MENTERIILIDADVVSHFVLAGEASNLNKIFPCPIHLLDKVHAELQRWPSHKLRSEISLLFSKKIIKLIEFPEDNEIIKKEYLWIKSMQFRGEGESACLAVARYNKNILASSNLKDIKNYCITHKIDCLTTMDFLCNALHIGLFDEKRCDSFIKNVLDANSKLPVKTMKEYQCKKIDFL